MEWWQAFVLGCVQGVSEFLPISSSGHLVVFQRLLALPQHDVVFDVAVHLGTVAAILTVYKAQILSLIRSLYGSRPCGSQSCDARQPINHTQPDSNNKALQGWRFLAQLMVASLPAGVLALLFRAQIESLFSSLVSTGLGFLLTAVLIGCSAYKMRCGGAQRQVLDWWVVVVIGLAQALAMVPGVSRSGSTIAAALLMGVGREQATFFSFSLAVPVILGAAVLQFASVEVWSAQSAVVLAVGIVSAYVFGLIGLRCVVALVARARWQVFVWYLCPLGLGCMIWGLMRG